MAGLKKILVALDDEAGAKTTLAWANRLACPGASKLLLVHVTYPNQVSPQYRERELDASRARLKSMAEAAEVTDPIQLMALEGRDPSRTIANAAWLEKCDLIVTGTRGGAPIKRWLVGGITENLIRQSLVPMMVVPHGTLPPAEGAMRNIYVPIDGSNLAEGIFSVAEALGILFEEARLTFLHVVPDVKGKERELRERLLHNLRERMDEYCYMLNLQGLPATFEVRRGDPATEILRVGRELADMIVMSTRGYVGIKRWVNGSTAEKILHGIHLPFVVHQAGTASHHPRPAPMPPLAARS